MLTPNNYRSLNRSIYLLLSSIIFFGLTACGGGGGGGDSGNAGAATTVESNIAPAISGAPIATVMAETEYLFTPDASDADGDSLHFSIENKPNWAVFDTETGTLWGVPGPDDVGTIGNIVISASDAQASTAMASFAVTVSPSGQGSVVLNWLPPTENEDGSSLTNLGSYRIYYGTAPEEMYETIDIINPGISSFVVENLNPDTYYFAATAISADGVESDMSAIAVYLVS
jgi:hypothetical protein